MHILAFDTTTPACAACLWQDGKVAARRSVAMNRGHAEALVPMLGEIMEETGAAWTDLDAVACTAGPGAFTGIRIGLATARGLALASGVPAVGVGTLEAMAESAAGAGASRPWPATARLMVALDTKRRDLFMQTFDAGGGALSAPEVDRPDAVADRLSGTEDGAHPWVLLGDGRRLLSDRVPEAVQVLTAHDTPDPAAIARLAARRLDRASRTGEPLAPPAPVYLRPPEARLPGQ